jgi:uncharacterized membrane protein YecN with MAPEG domain
MSGIQDWIYHWGEGAGSRSLKFLLLLITVVALAAIYDLRAYKCFSNPEAMETAQLARNLAEGKGYTTQVVRPLALHLLQQRAKARMADALQNLSTNRQTWTPEQRARIEAILRPSQLGQPLPDILTPPAYPVLLAGFMDLAPFQYELKSDQNFLRYQPEVLIMLLNQALLFLVVWMVFCLARKLFDGGVAWLTAVVLMAGELFWRISLSGLSTLLLMVLLLALVWCLVWLEQGAEEFLGLGKMLGLAALAGLFLGLGTLTRYSFACLGVPVVIFMIVFLGGRRVTLALTTLLVAGAVVTPWLWRNYDLSGSLFGAAAYAVYEGTASFPATVLPRSLNPDFTRVDAYDLPAKLVTGLRGMLTDDLPRLGGSWVSAFFLVGLLVPFKSQILSRLRVFLLIGLAIFTGAQALGGTPAQAETRATSSENLLVLFAPLVFMYGVGLFFTVLDQARASVWEARPMFIGGFIVLIAAPLTATLLPPRSYPVAYPPYSPPVIQAVSRWMQPEELMMSDIPWAVAWYGNRTCVWLPLNYQEDYQAINRQRPVQALYLTPQTMDNRFLSQWVQGENQGWGGFVAQCLLRKEVPAGFPLAKAYADLFPEQLFLTDRERWNEPPK